MPRAKPKTPHSLLVAILNEQPFGPEAQFPFPPLACPTVCFVRNRRTNFVNHHKNVCVAESRQLFSPVGSRVYYSLAPGTLFRFWLIHNRLRLFYRLIREKSAEVKKSLFTSRLNREEKPFNSIIMYRSSVAISLPLFNAKESHHLTQVDLRCSLE